MSAGQRHESQYFLAALNSIRIPCANGRRRSRPRRLAGDKGYSCGWIRRWLHRHKIRPVIPQRSDQEGGRGGCRVFDHAAYRARNAIERCVGWLKECRRIATRYDKLASSYLAFLKMAFIERYLRVLFRNGA